MQIDWLTVGAQWINFLILMWLLQRFLYKPIVRAMDKRQQAIAANMAEAAEKAQAAEQLADNYRNKLSELEAHRSVLLAAAREAADLERDKLITQARDEIETLSRQWRQAMEREQSEAMQQTKLVLGKLATEVAQRALHDLCSMDLQQALLSHFLQRLQNLSAENLQRLSESSASGIIVSSSFQLDAEQRKRIQNALRTLLNRECNLTFQPLTNSCCGLMVMTSAYTLEWRMEQYFTNLDADLSARFAFDKPHAGNMHV